MNNGQDAFRSFMKQLDRTRKSGGGGPAPKGLFAGTGLLVALVGGGLLLNASLFNGAYMFDVCRASIAHSFAVDGGHRAIKYTR